MAIEPTVYVVDDDSGALNSFCWLIRQADLPVRGYGSAREFLDNFDPDEPGCVVLDVRMPEMSGLDVQEQLAKRGVLMPIIFITSHGDVPTCSHAFRAGAFEFLEKPVDDEVLVSHIQKALARDADQRKPGSVTQYANRLSRLTPRELEVLDGLVVGKTLKEIATKQDVTVQTVWRHRGNIFLKMGVETEADLVRMATLWAQHRRV
jgi:FixJ family two-component response regulator